MTNETKSLVIEVKDQIANTFGGINDFSEGLAGAVSNSVVEAYPDGAMSDAGLRSFVTDTVTGAIHGVTAVGSGVEPAAPSIMVGIVRGLRRVGKGDVEAVALTAATLVREAFELGGSIGGTAKGAVRGAIAAAPELSISAEDAAAAAAWGVTQALGGIGPTAAQEVRRVLGKGVCGIKVSLEDPFEPKRAAPSPDRAS